MSHTPTESDIEAVVEKRPTVGVDGVSEPMDEKKVETTPHPRANLPNWKWILLLVGIYTGE